MYLFCKWCWVFEDVRMNLTLYHPWSTGVSAKKKSPLNCFICKWKSFKLKCLQMDTFISLFLAAYTEYADHFKSSLSVSSQWTEILNAILFLIHSIRSIETDAIFCITEWKIMKRELVFIGKVYLNSLNSKLANFQNLIATSCLTTPFKLLKPMNQYAKTQIKQD